MTMMGISKYGKTLYSAVEKPRVCQLCGKVAETRPYGPNGENVCFDCGMKDEASAIRQFNKRLGRHENMP